MQVETFEINEVISDGSVDKLDEQSVALIAKLGLAGQSSLVSRTEAGAVSVMPYQAMTNEEVAVYRELFPTHDAIVGYSAGPIPLRALQVAALATEMGWFTSIEVWHKRAGSAKEDPIMVGIVGGAHAWTVKNRFLLARWGDALRPYGDLVAEAAKICRAKLQSAVVRCQARLDIAAAQIHVVTDSVAIAWGHESTPILANENPPSEG